MRAQRKGQVSIYGTLDGVFAARQELLGCLPLVLMFDLPDESGKSIRDGMNGDTCAVYNNINSRIISLYQIKMKKQDFSYSLYAMKYLL